MASHTWHLGLVVATALVCVACGGRNEVTISDLPEAAGFTAPGEVALPDTWWSLFGDPSLESLVNQGLDQSLTLEAAWVRVEQANATYRRDASGLWPTVSADASLTQTLAPTLSNGTNLILGVSASYEIDLWGRVRAGRDAAGYDIIAREQDLDAAGISLSAEIAGAWYRLVELRAQRDLVERQRETNTTILGLVELRFGLGLVDAQDLLRQQQLIEQANAELASLQSDLEVQEHRLALLLGEVPGGVSLPADAELIAVPSLPSTGIPSELLQRRPDVLAAYARVEAADARAAVAASDRYPRLTLSASANTSAAPPGTIFVDWIANMVAGLSAPLFDGGRRRAELERAELVTEEAVLTYGQTVLSALTEVEDALARNRHEAERILSIEAQLALAVESFERARARYASGTADFLTVLNATTSYQQLERSLLSARRSLLQHRIDLCRALAGGWDVAEQFDEEE